MKKITNYDLIKSMSVDDLTEFISNITKVVAVKLGENYIVNDKKFIQQWLLQEVSDENITKIEHNSLCETKTYKNK